MSQEIFEIYGKDPINLYQRWYKDAIPLEPNDPEAICLATADAQGRPSNRFVLLKDIAENGFKFHTNSTSEKGCDIAVNPHVAFTHYWKSTRRQIRVTGTAAPVPEAESDEYFATRPRARAIGAWASDQSQPYTTQTDLAKSVSLYESKFKNTDQIPRPPQWQGYRIIPETIEFWLGNRDRLHTRFIYKRRGDHWTAEWLYP
jgi:pyridoxamine 5'-phosphate oxidase